MKEALLRSIFVFVFLLASMELKAQSVSTVIKNAMNQIREAVKNKNLKQDRCKLITDEIDKLACEIGKIVGVEVDPEVLFAQGVNKTLINNLSACGSRSELDEAIDIIPGEVFNGRAKFMRDYVMPTFNDQSHVVATLKIGNGDYYEQYFLSKDKTKLVQLIVYKDGRSRIFLYDYESKDAKRLPEIKAMPMSDQEHQSSNDQVAQPQIAVDSYVAYVAPETKVQKRSSSLVSLGNVGSAQAVIETKYIRPLQEVCKNFLTKTNCDLPAEIIARLNFEQDLSVEASTKGQLSLHLDHAHLSFDRSGQAKVGYQNNGFNVTGLSNKNSDQINLSKALEKNQCSLNLALYNDKVTHNNSRANLTYNCLKNVF